MSLNLRSQNPRALAHLSLGLDRLRRFQERPEELSVLTEAEDDLNKALQEDPAFLPAVYYRGLTRELRGDTELAISDLNRVIEANPPFLPEARFNLGVARFHRYHKPDLAEAETNFRGVLDNSSISDQLRLQTMASLAQVNAQFMIQKDPEKPDYDDIKSRFSAVVQAEARIRELRSHQTLEPSIAWRIENALGLGYMFASDYLPRIEIGKWRFSRPEMLDEARHRFEKADKASPNNWALFCNLGSIWMRSSYWHRLEKKNESDQSAFKTSETYLKLVLDKIRPGYAFALYEMGRLYRIHRHFGEALRWFRLSLEIPEGKRDVGADTLNREITRAEQENPVFP